MKTRMLVSILILILAVLIVSDGFAKRRKAIPIEDAIKQFEGIYVNTEYSGQQNQTQKFVITSDGRVEDWLLATNEDPSWKGSYTVAESWTDSKGDMYCKVDLNYGVSWVKELWRLDESGNTLEINYKFGRSGEYPTKIDPNADPSEFIYYWIGYRQ